MHMIHCILESFTNKEKRGKIETKQKEERGKKNSMRQYLNKKKKCSRIVISSSSHYWYLGLGVELKESSKDLL